MTEPFDVRGPSKELYEALLKMRGGRKEAIYERTCVLVYEVGRMLEYAMYHEWDPEHREAWLGLYKSELMDAITQVILDCQHIGVDFYEMAELGMEKAMERFTGKEKKTPEGQK